MNVEILEKSNLIVFKHIAGSHLYGTNVSTSDQDIRGIFRVAKEEYMSLIEPIQEVSDAKEDIKYYELKKFIELLTNANPNILEMLWIPKEHVMIQTPIMDKLLENRQLFITKKTYHSHIGYAFAQVKKARGSNKLVHNPQLAIMPKKEDFCWVIPCELMNRQEIYYLPFSKTPFRPIPIQEHQLNLNEYHVSALEHVSNTYRLYFYGKDSKGVFRGNDMLVCESIPFEDEANLFRGLLIYNQNEFEKALIEHRRYQDWMKNRNESRWVDQEKGLLTYDQKNLMHTVRLMISGKNILTNGEPIVKFTGDDLKYLMKIRRAEFTYEEIMADVEKRMVELKELFNKSTLPWGVNVQEVDKLYKELMDM